jgi:hypothetical protein
MKSINDTSLKQLKILRLIIMLAAVLYNWPRSM